MVTGSAAPREQPTHSGAGRIVSIRTNGEQNKNTERRQYATERFHGSLRYGLSLIRESRELSGN